MMSKIIVAPTSYGFAVLAAWPHPAVTPDAAWRPAAEIGSAKRFDNEVEARTYVARYLPELPREYVVIQDAPGEHETAIASALRELVASLQRAEHEGGSAATQDFKVCGVHAAVSNLRALLS